MVKPVIPNYKGHELSSGNDGAENQAIGVGMESGAQGDQESSPVDSTKNQSPKKSRRKLTRSKVPNSMQRMQRAIDKLRKENHMQLLKTDTESETERLGETWRESLKVTKHSISDRLEDGKTKPYLYASGVGFVLGRMYSSRKPGKGWVDSSPH